MVRGAMESTRSLDYSNAIMSDLRLTHFGSCVARLISHNTNSCNLELLVKVMGTDEESAHPCDSRKSNILGSIVSREEYGPYRKAIIP